MKFIPIKIIILFLFFQIDSIKAIEQTSEYVLKAAFIEKFARFTEWPPEQSKYFVITVLGKNPFGAALEQVAIKFKIKNKEIKIKYISNIKELSRTNILFISNSEANKINEILNYIKNDPILTISDSDGFALKGVHLNFYNSDEGTIHFEINRSKLNETKLKIDMYLLELARIIN